MARPKTTTETEENPARGRTLADAREAALRGEITRAQWAEAGFPPAKYPTGGKAEPADKAARSTAASRRAAGGRQPARQPEEEPEETEEETSGETEGETETEPETETEGEEETSEEEEPTARSRRGRRS